ncbi:hypothetical protein GCM10010270_80850 [Streptomyces violaceus]|nr:hypothetical protein GCM10010270_80850 [Streptomyces janthinus]
MRAGREAAAVVLRAAAVFFAGTGVSLVLVALAVRVRVVMAVLRPADRVVAGAAAVLVDEGQECDAVRSGQRWASWT